MAKAAKQGELDGLCGVYSVVNAIYTILPKETQENHPDLKKKLFRKALETFKNKSGLLDAILDGMDKDELLKVLESCKIFLNQLNLILDYEQLTRDYQRINGILNRVKEDKEHPNTAIIIGIESDDMQHWTVIKEIINNTIRFYDSCSLKEISIEEVGAKTPNQKKEYRIPADEVFSIWVNPKK